MNHNSKVSSWKSIFLFNAICEHYSFILLGPHTNRSVCILSLWIILSNKGLVSLQLNDKNYYLLYNYVIKRLYFHLMLVLKHKSWECIWNNYFFGFLHQPISKYDWMFQLMIDFIQSILVLLFHIRQFHQPYFFIIVLLKCCDMEWFQFLRLPILFSGICYSQMKLHKDLFRILYLIK